jgi:hypothetical protein
MDLPNWADPVRTSGKHEPAPASCSSRGRSNRKGGVMSESYYDSAPRAVPRPEDALDAFLAEHRLCRPGLEAPRITEAIVALDCSCSAALTVTLPPRPVRK